MSDNELPNVNSATIEQMQLAAKNPDAGPVFILNLNKYSNIAGFPDGALYKEYMQSISRLVSEVEGKILWRTSVNGQVVGSQDIDEVLGVWYPSNEAFLNIRNSPSSVRNMELRKRAVKNATMHWCDPYTVMRNP